MGSPTLQRDVQRYVEKVSDFKDEITAEARAAAPDVPGEPRERSARAINGRRRGLGFNPESYGTTRGRRRKGRVRITRAHGEVVNALAEWVEVEFRGKSEKYNSQMVDLGLYGNRGVRHVFEVKTTLGTQALYTGVGQLVMHSSGRATIDKTLVLPVTPRVRLGDDWKETLDRMGIRVLWYTKVGEIYDFVWGD
jgi:hypothetical protein